MLSRLIFSPPAQHEAKTRGGGGGRSALEAHTNQRRHAPCRTNTSVVALSHIEEPHRLSGSQCWGTSEAAVFPRMTALWASRREGKPSRTHPTCPFRDNDGQCTVPRGRAPGHLRVAPPGVMRCFSTGRRGSRPGAEGLLWYLGRLRTFPGPVVQQAPSGSLEAMVRRGGTCWGQEWRCIPCGGGA